MKTIVITGPSGSGKTYLSNQLIKIFTNSIIIKTDSYYRDNILIRLLSLFLYDIYDRPISIKKKEILNTLISIENKERLIQSYKYDFMSKNSSKSHISIRYKEDNQFIILEGIFSHRLNLNYKETINIVCERKKETCFKSRLIRDQEERGRNNREVKKKFEIAWNLFYQNLQNYLNTNKIIKLKQGDLNSYNKLIVNLKKIKNN